MIAPRPAEVGAQAWAALFGPPIAHRGLWSAERPENSLAAFEAAAAAGYGMELDVRLSRDGEAMVFHDDRLERMTEVRGRVAQRTAAELAEIHLAGSDEPIPTLTQALTQVDGRGLILVELKTLPGEEGPLEAHVAEVLATYAGPIGVLAFDPGALGWFADHAPNILRGLNVSKQPRDPSPSRIGRPHFLSLSIKLRPDRRHTPDATPVICWTVRSPADWAAMRPICDNLIFEGFRPEATA